jgi:hypothetical protein
MKLTTYNVFKDRVRELPEVIACGATPEIYRHHEEAWFNESNQVITEKSLVIFLNETKTKKIKSFRPARQKTCFFSEDR